MVRICVRDLGGTIITEVSMPPDSNVASLHRYIQERHGIDERLQKCLFNGTDLKGTYSFREYGLHQNAAITLIRLERKEPDIYSVRAECDICLLNRYCKRDWVEEEDQAMMGKEYTHVCKECSDKALERARKMEEDWRNWVRRTSCPRTVELLLGETAAP